MTKMLSSKVKIALEVFLKHQGEWVLSRNAIFFSWLKLRLSVLYKKRRIGIRLIRLCDFVISRCNGNRFIEFELSNICNARCVFCPYPDMLRTDKKFMHMHESILKKHIDKFDHFNSSLISFTPTTGDTLLHPNWDVFIEEALKHPKIHRATMFTNAIELDNEGRDKLMRLLASGPGLKLSEIYFSVGGLDAGTYKSLYQVDRFKLVVDNINAFLDLLHSGAYCIGVHIHVKMLKDDVLDPTRANELFNKAAYPFVYFSQSNLYFSNDVYTRNALVNYYNDPYPEKKKACAYLRKTRFAANGEIWADGCVISEMPGDSSLKLGGSEDSWETIERKRSELISSWEKDAEIPLPCRGCTMYRPG